MTHDDWYIYLFRFPLISPTPIPPDPPPLSEACISKVLLVFDPWALAQQSTKNQYQTTQQLDTKHSQNNNSNYDYYYNSINLTSKQHKFLQPFCKFLCEFGQCFCCTSFVVLNVVGRWRARKLRETSSSVGVLKLWQTDRPTNGRTGGIIGKL